METKVIYRKKEDKIIRETYRLIDGVVVSYSGSDKYEDIQESFNNTTGVVSEKEYVEANEVLEKQRKQFIETVSEEIEKTQRENNKNVEELNKVLSSTIGKEGTELLYKVLGIQNVVKGSK